MANGHQLSDISQNTESGLVFFDFLGAFVVRWPFMMADIINILSLVISLYSMFRNMKVAQKQGNFLHRIILKTKIVLKYVFTGISKQSYVKHLFLSFVFVILSWIICLFFNLFIGWNLMILNRQMSWYARPMWLFFLYVIPTLFVGMLVLLLCTRKQRKVWNIIFKSFLLILKANAFNTFYLIKIYSRSSSLHGYYFNYIMMLFIFSGVFVYFVQFY